MNPHETSAETEPHMDAATVLQAIGISAGYGDEKVVLEDVDCAVRPGELLGMVGPNGCGKSTLLKALAGVLRPTEGRVLLCGANMARLDRRQRARTLAMLPQRPVAPPGMTVLDLVRSGRTPYVRWLRPLSAVDHAAIDDAMHACSLHDLADRPLAELSGGECQRAWISMTLARQPAVLLLDEPTAALDIGHQLEVMQVLRRLVDQRQLAVLVVLHDINLALRFCDRMLVMHDGRLVGEYADQTDPDWSLLESVFDIRCRLSDHGERHLVFQRPLDRLIED